MFGFAEGEDSRAVNESAVFINNKESTIRWTIFMVASLSVVLRVLGPLPHCRLYSAVELLVWLDPLVS